MHGLKHWEMVERFGNGQKKGWKQLLEMSTTGDGRCSSRLVLAGPSWGDTFFKCRRRV